jgi:hypothetical protein
MSLLSILATVTSFSTLQVSSDEVFYNITNLTLSSYPNYNYYAYAWVATESTATLSFFFRQDPGRWVLDDVNIYHGGTELIINGGFETM